MGGVPSKAKGGTEDAGPQGGGARATERRGEKGTGEAEGTATVPGFEVGTL